jgi:predicted double-glycine peptidase
VKMRWCVSSTSGCTGKALALLLAASLGCAPRARGPSLPHDALAVPLVRQATHYSCGAAALLAVLYYWRAFDGNESALYGPLDTTEKDGTEPDAIERVARAHGLDANYRTGVTIADLRAGLAAGQTVIVDLQAWSDRPRPWNDDWDDGHYVVAVAVDQRYLYAMDPSADAGYDYLPLDELLRRWHDVDRKQRKWEHMAIFIAGRAHLAAYPAPLIEMR